MRTLLAPESATRGFLSDRGTVSLQRVEETEHFLEQLEAEAAKRALERMSPMESCVSVAHTRIDRYWSSTSLELVTGVD